MSDTFSKVGVITGVLEHHPHRALADFGGVFG